MAGCAFPKLQDLGIQTPSGFGLGLRPWPGVGWGDVLGQSKNQAAGPHAAPLLTRIKIMAAVRCLDDQILTKNTKNDQKHMQ